MRWSRSLSISFNVCNECPDGAEHGFSFLKAKVLVDIDFRLDVLHCLAVATVEGQLQSLVPDIRVLVRAELHELADEQSFEVPERASSE